MRTTTLFTLATCLAFTGIRPIAGQELTPLDRTPPTLKSMYYDVNGDGKMEYLDTENNKERFTAWFALDGTVVERVANDVLTIKNILELNGDGKPDFIASNGNDTKMYLSQPDGSYKATSSPFLGDQPTQSDLNRDGRMDLVFFKLIQSWPTLYARISCCRRRTDSKKNLSPSSRMPPNWKAWTTVAEEAACSAWTTPYSAARGFPNAARHTPKKATTCKLWI